MSLKKKSILSTVIMLFLAWILVEGFSARSALPVPAGSTREIHGSEEPGGHEAEAYGEETLHEAEAHGEEAHGGESWWRFSGWQIVFAGIGCFYFALVLAWLPLLVARKTKGEGH